MARKPPVAADVPAHVVKSTVESSDRAAAQQRRDDIRSGREDIKGEHYAGDDNSVRERYARYLEKLDRQIGAAQAEKRKILSALVALADGLGMGSTADKQDDGGSIRLKPEPKSEPVPERERKHPKPEQGNAYKLPEQKPQPTAPAVKDEKPKESKPDGE